MTRRAPWALVLALAPLAALGADDVCKSPVTTDIVACLQKRLEPAKEAMARELAEIHRLGADERSDMTALDAAQEAWRHFVDVDCKAVYEHWSAGTIRGPMTVGCELAHTRARTCALWETYLAHMATTLGAPSCPPARDGG